MFLHVYGFILGLGILAGFQLTAKRLTRFGLKTAQFERLLLPLCLGALLGARIYHVLDHLLYYRHQPLKFFAIWEGGLAIYGALLGAAIVLAVYIIRQQKNSPESRWSRT